MHRNLIYVTLVVIYGVFCYLLLKAGLTGEGVDVGARAGVGQLIADLVLLPIVLIGFRMAILEFRAVSERPTLQLEWDVSHSRSKGTSTAREPSTPNQATIHGLAIRNSGPAVAVWYEVTLRIPWEILTHPPKFDVTSKIGEEINWEGCRYTQSENVVVFRSHGRYAVYPNSTVRLADLILVLNSRIKRNDTVVLPYKIVGEKIAPTEGELRLEIAPPIES